MPLQDIIERDQRRLILEALAEDRAHSHNAHILRGALQMLGHDIRIDQAVAQVEWLAAAGLVEIAAEGPPLVARLTERGLAVALGKTVAKGVALKA